MLGDFCYCNEISMLLYFILLLPGFTNFYINILSVFKLQLSTFHAFLIVKPLALQMYLGYILQINTVSKEQLNKIQKMTFYYLGKVPFVQMLTIVRQVLQRNNVYQYT